MSADRAPTPAKASAAVEQLGSFIREQRRSTQMSLRKLASLAGVSNPYLSQIERGLRKPSAEILQQIARALSVSSETLYVRAGILEPRTDEADVVGEIRRDPHLNDEQRETLIRVYQSLRHEAGGEPDGPGQELPPVRRR